MTKSRLPAGSLFHLPGPWERGGYRPVYGVYSHGDAPLSKAVESLPAGTLIPGAEITPDELQLAGRNHSMPLEALRYPITPIGLHYLLTHFDIPFVDPHTWELSVGGSVRRALRLRLDEIKARPSVTFPVTLECAGNGRARL